MFPIDSLPAQYFEERQAAEAARRSQEQHGKAQTTATACQAQSQSQQQQHRAFLQRPQLSRPASSTVLGNIFQGFVRNGQSPPPGTRGTASGSSTPATTPPAKITTQAELEVLMAEKKRDADYIGSSPGWW